MDRKNNFDIEINNIIEQNFSIQENLINLAASNRCLSKSSIFQTYVYLDEFLLHIFPYLTDLLIKISINASTLCLTFQ